MLLPPRFARIASLAVVLTGFCLPAATAQPPAAPQPPRQPNILFIMADDHASHAIRAYGSRINGTPNIDRLAREGMRFANCFCENSLCVPSRAAILTGTFGCRSGVTTLSTKLDAAKTTFPKLLGAAGYQTAMVGKWHLHRDPAEFDHWDMLPGQGTYHDPVFLTPGKRTPHKGYSTDIITDKCIDWLERRDAARPFLMLCHFNAPHRPWQPDEKHERAFAQRQIPEPATFDDDYSTRSDAARRQKMSIEHDLTPKDLKQTPPDGFDAAATKRWKYQRYMRDYLACIASVDDNVGRLLDYLDTEGLAADTIVIYTSDQGFFLGDHGWYDKRWMYEESLRMPLIVRQPGRVAAGSVCGQMVQNVDFAPTLLELAGIAAPAEMQGESIRPLLEGRTPEGWRDAVYYHYYEEGTEHRVAAHFGVRTERYKLIRFYSEVRAWEFYDLEKDPHELHNAYSKPEYAELIAGLKSRLEAMRKEYGDATGAMREEAEAARAPATEPTIVEELQRQAEAVKPLVSTSIGREFLGAARSLSMPEPAVRTVYRDRERGLALTAAEWAKQSKEEQAKYTPRECGPEFYYTTGYGTPLAYARAWDVLGAEGAKARRGEEGTKARSHEGTEGKATEQEDGAKWIEGKKVLDFGYGGIGPLRILAQMGADAHGVDVEPLFAALYSEPGDTGVIGAGAAEDGRGARRAGKITLHTGRWPADEKIKQEVGEGYDVFISKNTLKAGYIDPAREVDERFLVKLGVDDETFLRAVFDLLKPGGWALIYNISPAQSPPDKPYLPHADGKCPWPREMLERAGFTVLAHDTDDTPAILDYWMAMGLNNGKSREEVGKDLFAWYTLMQRPE